MAQDLAHTKVGLSQLAWDKEKLQRKLVIKLTWERNIHSHDRAHEKILSLTPYDTNHIAFAFDCYDFTIPSRACDESREVINMAVDLFTQPVYGSGKIAAEMIQEGRETDGQALVKCWESAWTDDRIDMKNTLKSFISAIVYNFYSFKII